MIAAATAKTPLTTMTAMLFRGVSRARPRRWPRSTATNEAARIRYAMPPARVIVVPTASERCTSGQPTSGRVPDAFRPDRERQGQLDAEEDDDRLGDPGPLEPPV